MNLDNKKKVCLYVLLASILLTSAILAEIIGVKIFSLEKSINIQEFKLKLFQNEYSFNLTAGVLLWPVVFISTDIINEYFGKKGVRLISFVTAIMIAYMFVVFSFVTKLQPADFWIKINQNNFGSSTNINDAFSIIFNQGLSIIAASLISFLLSQFLDVSVFQWLKKNKSSNKIWLKATGSTLVSQFVDSFFILFVAFFLFGNWSFNMVISIGLVNYIYKFMIAILLTPILYFVHKLIDGYLGQKLAKELKTTSMS